MRLTMTVRPVAMRLTEPLRVSGYLFEAMPAVVVTLSDGNHTGRGEAAGVYYLDDDQPGMLARLDSVRTAVEAGIDRATLQHLLPPGGVRNALDCALWELDSHRAGIPVSQLAGLGRPRPLVTTFTIPADAPSDVARKLAALPHPRAIKLKLDGNLDADAERIGLVRKARPDVWLGVDANQGYDGDTLDPLIALLADADVSLLEQPLPRGSEHLLEGRRFPLPIAADESVTNLVELEERHACFDVINIKLDKCGGLTEALDMVRRCEKLGKRTMVGNMAGSRLAAAPAFVLGQLCEFVDLDGPYFLADTEAASGIYRDGLIDIPDGLWGAAVS